ncbi:DUF6083 domain-containing protein [Kitasatospora sp. NPDC088346]|uniref:DUF6083 domain-containing protein n=1 Tax=Kitasatospora sp. NPDC088346 TaxID=3364073 RepID=UPI0037F38060
MADGDYGNEDRKKVLEAWAGAIGRPSGAHYSPYSRCRECLTSVEWRMTLRGKWVPFQPKDYPRDRMPARVAWSEDEDGLMRPGRRAARCRLIHYAVCPARIGTLEPELDAIRRMLGVRGRNFRIDSGEDEPLRLVSNEYGLSVAAQEEGALWTAEEVAGQQPRVEVSRWDNWLQVRPQNPASLSDEIYVALNRMGERTEDSWRIPRTPKNEGALRRFAVRNDWTWADLPGAGPAGTA